MVLQVSFNDAAKMCSSILPGSKVRDRIIENRTDHSLLKLINIF